MQKAFLAMLALLVVAPAFAFIAVPQAEAACSINGLINSRGNCARSYSNSSVFSRFDGSDDDYYYDEDRDDDDDDDYRDRARDRIRDRLYFSDFEERYRRILELLALIRELQAILAGRDIDVSDSEIDVTTRSANDIEDDRATLRGEVDFGTSDFADVWFEWGESLSDLDEDTDEERIEDDEDEDFEETVTGLDEGTRYYFRAVGEDEDGEHDRGRILSFVTDGDRDGDDDPDVETDDADDVTDDSAELNGSVDMNDFNNGRVFFVYGEDEDQIDDIENDYDEYGDVEEDGEDLQKVLVDSDLDSDESYSEDVSGLDTDTTHYFAICVEYEDEYDDPTISCGSTESFTTGENDGRDDEPDADADPANDIDEDSAVLNGSVDMNDFNDGLVFFVYGEDESQIEDVADEHDQYPDIDEDGEDLQKTVVDNDLDGSGTYAVFVDGLDSDTGHFFSICVEYENDGDDLTITCSAVEEFTTDD